MDAHQFLSRLHDAGWDAEIIVTRSDGAMRVDDQFSIARGALEITINIEHRVHAAASITGTGADFSGAVADVLTRLVAISVTWSGFIEVLGVAMASIPEDE